MRFGEGGVVGGFKIGKIVEFGGGDGGIGNRGSKWSVGETVFGKIVVDLVGKRRS